ncbi:MAG TPA: helix-turn-helix domain-containing protein [Xanthomonadaceae bacterium]|nr:helix-turn-helix domain-containing protein [Xanthomonadaceae bacterium]
MTLEIKAPIDLEEGDENRFCGTCAFSGVCRDSGVDKVDLRKLSMIVEHTEPMKAGTHLYRVGERFQAIFAVRVGTVMTYVSDEHGREQVLGIHLPGEMLGLDAIDPERYQSNAVALEPTSMCRFHFPDVSRLATELPQLQRQLFKLLSRDIARSSMYAGDYTAEERLAAFLLDLSARFEARGYSPREFRLTMARKDIANYLRLATETVSRVLGRFQDDGLIGVDRRLVTLLDPERLQSLARPVLRR